MVGGLEHVLFFHRLGFFSRPKAPGFYRGLRPLRPGGGAMVY